MENLSIAQTSPLRWPLFLAGIALFVLGPILYGVRVKLQHQLESPIYVPALATLGVLSMALSVWQDGGLSRSIGLGVFALLCGFEWYLVLVASGTPQYTGPAQEGNKLPAFAVRRADGGAFSDRDLEKGTPTVLLFFRGHW